MKFQNKIIGFCYLYIIGVASALLAPLDPAWVPTLKVITAAAIIPAAVLFIYGMASWNVELEKKRVIGVARWLGPLMMVGALLMGYTRYLSVNTVPDMRIGEILLNAGERSFRQTASLPDTSRLRIRKSENVDKDLRLRLVGELDARKPVRDDHGLCIMDAEGRWQFQLIRTPLTSDVVVVSADDPVGTGYVIDQPFTRITGIVWEDGPDTGRVIVERISNHIGSFARPGRGISQVTVLGRITGDPRVYDFKTVLAVTPEFVQYPAGGPYFRVEGGDLQVTVSPAMDGYSTYARTAAYGVDVEMKGELTVARAAANPGGFNAKKFLQNYNIYGLMNLRQPRGGAVPVNVIVPEGGDPRVGSPLVVFSLQLRDKVLRVFKATMPYPQSAFLGGVTLGLRYGLQGARWPGEGVDNAFGRAIGLGKSENQIADDFRASGVNHVLAVSGLHVTIITAMFMAIFSLMRLPKKFFVPFVIFALVVFAIITGARPSTLRAVIMNSLFLLTWAYLDKGLLASVMIGVPVAAFIILLHNPLVVVDPSFTLSFGAILSLALITMPVHEILCHLRGNTFLAVIVAVFITTVIGVVNWPLVTTASFIIPWLLICIVLYVAAGELEKRGAAINRNFAFSNMPEPVSTFIAAQVAIQVGMMIPLSAYYFSRWPFGGAYANLVAIPLIGVVVQLGAIGGILGLVPGVGPFIALLLNGANWIFTNVFLWLAHVFTLVFPYPFVRRPRVIEVLVYYFFVGGFIWHKPVWKWIKSLCESRGWKHRAAPAWIAVGLCILATSPLWFAPPRDNRPDGLHITVLSAGYGSSILVESPGGKKILVDTGFVEHDRGRRNEAVRTILPFLSYMNIDALDGLVLTSPLPERSAGASYILEQQGVDNLFVPPGMEHLSSALTYQEFIASMGLTGSRYDQFRLNTMYDELIVNSEWPERPSLTKALRTRGNSPANRWSGQVVNVQPVEAGMALFEETHDGKTFRIEVLGPGKERPMELPLENSSIVLRVVYGDFAMLLPGALQYEGQGALASSWNADQLKSQIMVVPHNAAAIPGGRSQVDRQDVEDALDRDTKPLLKKVQPEKAIVEFGNPRPVLGMESRTAINVHDITKLYYREQLGDDALLSTDSQLAISIYSDGVSYSIDTQAARNRALGGDEDAVSDLSLDM